MSQSMSELGALNGPHFWIMNIFGFQLLGIFLVFFVFGLKSHIYSDFQSKIGSILILIGGISLI